MYQAIIKPSFDFLFSVIILLCIFPILLILTILLFFVNGGKPFFLQKRPGKNEKIFTIIKFKTMNDKKDEYGNLLPDMERITKVGKFVRGASLDELLQLFNVLKGDMSFVGPRPLLVAYLALYTNEQARRHLVRPGITGWAQVKGRNSLSWEQKFEHDSWYVKNIGFITDIKILIKTVQKVLKRDGIAASESDTMERFTGTNTA
ncbi:sugar transferase [Croceitalea marina]|uniref:Sugar transferase n=1 Tax=Croceitalea marina TaxID=1775166 RepID=A0ABW5N0F5_9FLAO